MRLVIPYCVGDIQAALRLIKWIGFLSSRYANSMSEEAVLLVASPQASQLSTHTEIVNLAARVFAESTVFVPSCEKEVGWPGSANWMFEISLAHVEEQFQDAMLWMEPDAIPITPAWYDHLRQEWQIATKTSKHFVGNLVPAPVPHMTGVAIYGPDWRQVAPGLSQCPDAEAFDVYSAPQVLPLARITPLIQHVFRRHDPGWSVPSLSILDDRAVIFHQCKTGRLIKLLDHNVYQGECSRHPLFSYQTEFTAAVMTKFYRTENATRAVNAHGKRIAFDPLESFGGAVPGVYATMSETEQLGLDGMVSDPTTGITEITQEEWESTSKKKAPPSNRITSAPSSTTPLKLPLSPNTSRAPARLVAEPVRSVGEASVGTAQITDIDDVLKVDSIAPSQPSPSKAQGKPTSKPQKK